MTPAQLRSIIAHLWCILLTWAKWATEVILWPKPVITGDDTYTLLKESVQGSQVSLQMGQEKTTEGRFLCWFSLWISTLLTPFSLFSLQQHYLLIPFSFFMLLVLHPNADAFTFSLPTLSELHLPLCPGTRVAKPSRCFPVKTSKLPATIFLLSSRSSLFAMFPWVSQP